MYSKISLKYSKIRR